MADNKLNGEFEENHSSLWLLQERIGYHFVSDELLTYALTHRSAGKKVAFRGTGSSSPDTDTGGESDDDVAIFTDYERLEFLGDAVLDLAVADLLLHEYPAAREGELSKMRAALVNTESLAGIARELDLSQCVVVSRAEKAQSGHQRPAILADVLESIIGAIYREAGFEKARKVVTTLFAHRVREVDPKDPKTELQEALHSLGKPPPEYVLERVEGPEHAPTFVSAVSIAGEFAGRGDGKTKKASQQAAAREALLQLETELAPLSAKFLETQSENTDEGESHG